MFESFFFFFLNSLAFGKVSAFRVVTPRRIFGKIVFCIHSISGRDGSPEAEMMKHLHNLCWKVNIYITTISVAEPRPPKPPKKTNKNNFFFLAKLTFRWPSFPGLSLSLSLYPQFHQNTKTNDWHTQKSKKSFDIHHPRMYVPYTHHPCMKLKKAPLFNWMKSQPAHHPFRWKIFREKYSGSLFIFTPFFLLDGLAAVVLMRIRFNYFISPNHKHTNHTLCISRASQSTTPHILGN